VGHVASTIGYRRRQVGERLTRCFGDGPSPAHRHLTVLYRGVEHGRPHTYVVSEIVGTSNQDLGQAISNGIARASRTLRNLDWFQVAEVRGSIRDGVVQQFQVTLKVGFRLEDNA
jgi:flavin-binding protein dodecin